MEKYELQKDGEVLFNQPLLIIAALGTTFVYWGTLPSIPSLFGQTLFALLTLVPLYLLLLIGKLQETPTKSYLPLRVVLLICLLYILISLTPLRTGVEEQALTYFEFLQSLFIH